MKADRSQGNTMHKRAQLQFLLYVLYLSTTYASSTDEYLSDKNTVVSVLPTGVTPDDIAITPDNKYAYVANNNNYGIAGQDSVSVYNLYTNTLQQTIYDSSFNQPFRIAISPDGKKAYVANSNGTTLSIIDTKLNTVVGTINGFDGPSGVAISPDGKVAYVNNYGGPDGVGSGNGTTVNVVNLVTNTITNTIVVGLAPAALTMSPDGKFVYVINYSDGNPGTGFLSIIQRNNNLVVGSVFGLSGPFGIAVTPNGKYAYVTNFGSNNFAPFGTTVSVIDLKQTRQIVATIGVGIQPAGIAITPDGRFAYVTNYNTLYAGPNFSDLTAGGGTVNIIDLTTNKVLSPTIGVGQSPNTVKISPNGRFAYVTNFTSNTLNVIRLTPHPWVVDTNRYFSSDYTYFATSF